MEVRSDRTYRFELGPDALWSTIGRVDEYRRWWPWLRRMDARGLVEGDRWDCVVQPPMPYKLRFSLELVDVDEPRRIEAAVSGDLTGEAAVTFHPADGGCTVHLRSVLAPARGPLRTVAELAPWLARRGHDWVLDTGFRQFRRRAI